jgi:putative flippase GtrA
MIGEDSRRREPVWGQSSHALIEFARFTAIGGLAALVNLISR